MMTKSTIKKMLKANRRVNEKMLLEAMQLLRVLRRRPRTTRRRYELESPFFPPNRGQESDDPRAVYL
jgi:hypothetical protein